MNEIVLIQLQEKHKKKVLKNKLKNYSSSPDSLTTDRSDKSNTSPSPVALYKLVVPLLRCEVADVRDAAVSALGMINHDALKYGFSYLFLKRII